MGSRDQKAEGGTGITFYLWFSACCLLIVSLVVSGSFFYRLRPVGDSKASEIEIKEGLSAAQVARLLADAGLIRDSRAFHLWSRITGNTRHLKAGWYRFDPRSSARSILDQMVRGDTIRDLLVVPEGYTLDDIAAIWENENWGTRQEFIEAADRCANQRISEIVSEQIDGSGDLQYPAHRILEGYLFPDTYYLERGTTAQACIQQMLRRFDQQWSKLTASSVGSLSKRETVILASIVEKEARVDDERSLIAGVFYNRLRLGWKLQADPTVAYVLGYPRRKLTHKDLEIDSLYNTYRYGGLPPGPICNPGYASLKAAWQPAKTDMMYFVARGDGTHHFSRTLTEHNKARKGIKASMSPLD